MLSLADLLTAACGLNVTEIVQDASGARLAGQLFVCANQLADVPVRSIPSTATGTAPLFVNVALKGSLVVPTGTLPNRRLVGLTDAATFTVSFFDLVRPFAVPAIVA